MGFETLRFGKKLLSEDRTFQEALQVAIADEIAAKETLQVQQQQLPQPVNSVAKEFSTLLSSSSGKSATQSITETRPFKNVDRENANK